MTDDYTLSSSGLFLKEQGIEQKKIILDDSDYKYFIKPQDYGVTTQQREELEEQIRFINWGRRNPVLFAEEIFGIELLDYQKYVFMNSWNTPYSVWCMSRNGGKSILGSIFIEAKTLLIPNHTTYILCGVGSQSVELFTKIEMLTNNGITSFKSLTDVFAGELVRSAANSNGFVHNPASYRFNLYNNSRVFTLNGSFDNNRSKRSNLNFYDEASYSPDELFSTSEPFCTQNSKFGLGTDYDEISMLSEPDPFANQCIYASSAGRTDQYFFRKYKEASLRMDAGDKRYFCADINSDVIISATKRGVGLPEALLTQETIDARLREDKEAGLREYKNIFTSEGGDGQIIKRSDIIKNSVPRVPVFKNEDNKKTYGIAYDPARRHDNSAIVVGEFYFDSNVGWKLRIVNAICLMDLLSKKKIPINTPAQIQELKSMIVRYNGEQVADFENITSVLVDAGSGGAGVPITDFLCEDFIIDGITHRGLIDQEFNEGDAKRYPGAVKDKLRLVSPAKYKTDLFESLIKMMDLDLIEFTEEYNNKGYINLIYEVDSKGGKKQRYTFPNEKEEKDLNKRGIVIESIPYHLNAEEEVALKQIDMMKTELVNIYRYDQSNGKDRFDLASDKANKLNDDRVYCLALLGWQLALLRRDHIVNKKKPKEENLVNMMPFRQSTRYKLQ